MRSYDGLNGWASTAHDGNYAGYDEAQLSGLDSSDFRAVDDPPFADGAAPAIASPDIASEESEQLRELLGRRSLTSLRDCLEAQGLDKRGRKAQLVDRLALHTQLRYRLTPGEYRAIPRGCRNLAQFMLAELYSWDIV